MIYYCCKFLQLVWELLRRHSGKTPTSTIAKHHTKCWEGNDTILSYYEDSMESCA
jgi:hypothetical protein